MRISIFIILFTAATAIIGGCRDKTQPPVLETVPESFSLFDIGPNTLITNDVRDRLNDTLGSAGVNPNTTIDLEHKNSGFLKSYYPELDRLNRRINPENNVRKEYPATKLAFRNMKQKKALYNYVELIFLNKSSVPLMFQMTAEGNLDTLLDTLIQKYGSPRIIELQDGKGKTYSWERNGDRLIFTHFISIYEQSEYYIMIVFVNRFHQLLEKQKQEEEKKNLTLERTVEAF
jgi:hypothetical protein